MLIRRSVKLPVGVNPHQWRYTHLSVITGGDQQGGSQQRYAACQVCGRVGSGKGPADISSRIPHMRTHTAQQADLLTNMPQLNMSYKDLCCYQHNVDIHCNAVVVRLVKALAVFMQLLMMFVLHAQTSAR